MSGVLQVTHPVAQGPIGVRADRNIKRTRSSFEEGNQESSSHNKDPISRKARSTNSRLLGLDAIIAKYGQLGCHDRTPASDTPSSSNLRQTAARQTRRTAASASQNSQPIPSSMNTGCTALRMRPLSQTERDARDPTDSNGNERGGRRERRTLGRTSGHGRNGYELVCPKSFTSRSVD